MKRRKHPSGGWRLRESVVITVQKSKFFNFAVKLIKCWKFWISQAFLHAVKPKKLRISTISAKFWKTIQLFFFKFVSFFCFCVETSARTVAVLYQKDCLEKELVWELVALKVLLNNFKNVILTTKNVSFWISTVFWEKFSVFDKKILIQLFEKLDRKLVS